MYTVLSKHYSLGPVFRMLASDQDWSLQARNSYITKARKAHSRLNMAYSYTKNLTFYWKKTVLKFHMCILNAFRRSRFLLVLEDK